MPKKNQPILFDEEAEEASSVSSDHNEEENKRKTKPNNNRPSDEPTDGISLGSRDTNDNGSDDDEDKSESEEKEQKPHAVQKKNTQQNATNTDKKQKGTKKTKLMHGKYNLFSHSAFHYLCKMFGHLYTSNGRPRRVHPDARILIQRMLVEYVADMTRKATLFMKSNHRITLYPRDFTFVQEVVDGSDHSVKKAPREALKKNKTEKASVPRGGKKPRTAITLSTSKKRPIEKSTSSREHEDKKKNKKQKTEHHLSKKQKKSTRVN